MGLLLLCNQQNPLTIPDGLVKEVSVNTIIVISTIKQLGSSIQLVKYMLIDPRLRILFHLLY